MKRFQIVFFCIMICAAVSSQAALEIFPLSGGTMEKEIYAPSVASNPNGTTMVAYNTHGVLLMTFVEVQQLSTRGGGMPSVMLDPVGLGAGYSPKISWSTTGWICAYSSYGMLFIYESDLDGNWDMENFTMIENSGAVGEIDLWCVENESAAPGAYITYQVWNNPPVGGFEVWYVTKTRFGWSDPELVVTESNYSNHPKLSWAYSPSGPLPTLYFQKEIGGEFHLMQTTRDLSQGWSTPTEIYGDGVSTPTLFGSAFDVVNHGSRVDIVGTGPAMTCPCRTMLHQEYDGGWQVPVDITGNHEVNNEAYSPVVARDDLGQSYAFWMQEGSDDMLVPHSRHLEYRVLKNGVWQDYGSLLNGHHVASLENSIGMDVSPIGEPVLAWTRSDSIAGVPQGAQIWIARINGPSGVGDEMPAVVDALSAWPNPFNPRVKLAVDVVVGGPVRLDIHDARGLRLDTLINETLAADRHEVMWDGTDRMGRSLPSGVYFARAVTATGTTVEKLVLAR